MGIVASFGLICAGLGSVLMLFWVLVALAGTQRFGSGLSAELSVLAILFGAAFWVFSELQLAGQLAIRLQQHGRIAISRVVQVVGVCGSQLALGYLGAGVLGVALGQLLGLLCGAVALGLPVSLRAPVSRPACRVLGAVFKKFGRLMAVGSVQGVINGAGQVYMLLLMAGGLFGGEFAGQLFLAARVATLPIAVVGTAVSQYYVGSLAERLRARRRILPLLVKTMSCLALAGVAGFVVASSLLPDGFAVVFGARWIESGRIAALLLIVSTFQFCISPVGQTLSLLQLQYRILSWDVLRMVGTVVLCGGAKWSGLANMDVIRIYVGWQVLLYVVFGGMTVAAAMRSDRLLGDESKGGAAGA